MIYLDHNATTFPSPSVLEKVQSQLSTHLGNPSSVHQQGRMARGIIEQSRLAVANALAVSSRNLTFCSSATEAIHLALCGFLLPHDHVLVSAVEHPAIWGALEICRADVEIIPVDEHGKIDPQWIVQSIRKETKLVIVMAGQNEIGNLYPIEQIAKAIAPVPLFCDGVQALGKVPFYPEKMGCAMSVFSGHKIGGLLGCGVLWTKPGIILKPYLAGGAQERGRRAGTENTLAITAFAQACAILPERLTQMQEVAKQRDWLIKTLQQRLPSIIIHGDQESHLPNTISCRVDGIDGELCLQALDLKNVCISSGSACSSGALEPSKVLKALGLTDKQARSGLRISLGIQSTWSELEAFVEIFCAVASQLRLSTN
jgi:cysteine desulfurase